jgi:adenylate kinase family enzyme
MVAAGKIIPAEMIVRMLRKIIYSGDSRKHFLLSSFPDIIEQAKEFEKSCASITAIIYAARDENKVEIKNNNLSLFNIDALFQKEFRLKILNEPHSRIVSEIKNETAQITFIYGKPLSGKSSVAKIFANKLGCKVVEWSTFHEQVKKSMGGDEENAEAEPPFDKVQAAFFDYIHN